LEFYDEKPTQKNKLKTVNQNLFLNKKYCTKKRSQLIFYLRKKSPFDLEKFQKIYAYIKSYQSINQKKNNISHKRRHIIIF